MKYCFLILALFLKFSVVNGQEIDHQIKSYVDEDEKIYWNKRLPMYVRIASTPDDPGVLLKSNKQAKHTNPLYLDTEGVNYIRTRWAVDTGTMKIATPKVEIMMEVYADSRPPAARLSISDTPQKTTNDTLYYGNGLEISVASEDQLSGVETDFFKINGGTYSKYKGPINFQNEGSFVLSYYSLDNVGNFTQEKSKSFIVDLNPPVTFHNINGLSIDNVITTSTKLYFTGEDSLSGVSKTYYKFDEGDFKLYNGKSLDISDLTEGHHILNYYSVDFVQNKEEDRAFKFYYDKTAPIMAADILGDRFISEEQIYFSGRTKLKLTAVDNKVGVKDVMYSINNAPYEVYKKPFYLPSISGVHLIRYYSEDNLSNRSKSKLSGNSAAQFKHNVNKVYVDLTGPDITRSYLGRSYRARDTVFINKETKLVFKGNDPESGLGEITYSMDGQSEETDYIEPFTIPNSGYHAVSYYGYDKVNNRNVGNFFLFSDHTGPAIFTNFSTKPYETKKGLDVYASDIGLYLAATDDKVGLADIYYKINNDEFREFTGKLKDFKRNTKFSIVIKAVDHLGNETLSEVEFYTGK